MLDGRLSSCINHPGISAAARCKQCGKPLCPACVISSPLGTFCSDSCREKFENFSRRVQEVEQKSSRGRWNVGVYARKILSFLLSLLVVFVLLGVLGTVFNIPVLSQWIYTIRGWIGI